TKVNNKLFARHNKPPEKIISQLYASSISSLPIFQHFFAEVGKTGTAEKLTADGHGKRKYLKNSSMSSFLGLLPASNPQYVVFIMFDEPKGIKESFGFATAGWTAAPTVGRVLERMVSLYGIEPIEKGEEL
ncbi:MAG: hypothetical protein LN575_04915, partial [Rickettsia endosymbiont of Gnoriste bilineata]|nr:hypothetical protein [Rickettsia endosymbiont of Gnoriste bilineata]